MTTAIRRERNPQQDLINRRLPFVVAFLVMIAFALLVKISSYQWLSPEREREIKLRGEQNVSSTRRLPAERGIIYDRGGQPLAFNTIQYEIGVSPNLITSDRKQGVATQLAIILGLDEFDIYQKISAPSQWQQIARPVNAEVGQQVADEEMFGVIINPLSKRFYPQGLLAGQLIGFVIEDNDNTRGALGVEESYNAQLAGRVVNQEIINVPFQLPIDQPIKSQHGTDLVLTIDRDVQFWVEYELQQAVLESGSDGGTIIVMDPRNGDILAMASTPLFDPNNFGDYRANDLKNAAISNVYEPGSTMKVLTVAGALQSGAITPQWTYNDQGVFSIGGIDVKNWDRQAHGVTDVSTALSQSLNVGMATIATEMGQERFYTSMRSFGFGQRTGIDLPGEEAGILRMPGDSDWSESNLATNSFGQGVSITPLQMITAVSAIANDGLMMQPRIVRQIVNGDTVTNAQPMAIGRPISAVVAKEVTTMMLRAVAEEGGGVPLAQVPGYTIAGKTGTAEIPSPTGYESGTSIASFVGFFPADDPQVIILVKLDRPDEYWGSVVAAPVFKTLAERLVILLGIPTDDIRRQLQASGGRVNER